MKRIFTLIKGDFKNITRDPILLMSLIAPVLLLLVTRYGIPWVTELLKYNFDFDLLAHYQFIISYFALLTPLMIGVLAGFMILDERDEGVLAYYSVTPLSKTGYLLYRLLFPLLIGFLMTFLFIYFSGLIEFKFFKLLPIVLMMALEGPMMALYLAAFASNKVEGLALAKAGNSIILSSFVAYLIEAKWGLLAGLFPPYWVTKVFLAAYDLTEFYYLYLVLGFMIHLLFIIY